MGVIRTQESVLEMRILLLLALLIPGLAFAQIDATINLAWTAPYTREDGSALPADEIGSYVLQRVGGGVIATVGKAEVGTTIGNFTLGYNEEFCVQIKTIDTDSKESDWSTAACLTTPKSGPNAPTSLTIDITIGVIER
jgi:hypothetical protein